MIYSFHERQAEKVRKVLRERNIDVLILTNQQKISYVAGTYHSNYLIGISVFLWANGDPTLLISIAEKGRMMFDGYIKDVQFWNGPYYGLKPSSFSERCVEILRERGMEKGTIAVEEPSIYWAVYSTLRTKLPKANFINGEKLIDEVMMIKDSEELQKMKRASAIADVGLQAIKEGAKIGITECKLMGIAECAMRELGCSYFYNPNQMSFDNRIITDHYPSDNILQFGDKIDVDFHPVWEEYRGDYERTLSFGKPDKEYEKMAEVCTEAAYDMVKSLRPGASTRDIEVTFRERIKKAGYPDNALKDLGHGIGTGHLPPWISMEDMKLQDNMIISIAPYIYSLGEYTFVQEFCVLVHKDGGIPLNKEPLGLIIL
jgi:Xaa-Pro aminopeptidase